LLLACGVPLSIAAATHTAAGDWPQWRGPGRNGLEENSPALIDSLAGQAPVWQSERIASGDDGGRGSLVVSGNRVYGMTSLQSDSGRFDEVFCLDAGDGGTIWRSRLPDPAPEETGSSTPCVSGGRLYVVGSAGSIYCLDADTGEPIWTHQLSRKGSERISSSVAVVEGVAIVLADVLTGLDAHTGDLLWTQPTVAGHESSPAVWKTDQRDFVLCNSKLETHCVDPANGEVLWSVPGGGLSTPVVAQEYGGDFLVNMGASRKNGLSAYRLTPQGPQRLWTLRAFDRAASPVVFDGHVYAIAGGSNGHRARVLCVHLDTGKPTWEETIEFAEVSSPIVADGKLFAICGTLLWLVQATPERYTILGQHDPRITLCTSPALQDGKLYLRQADAVVCFDLRLSRSQSP
jgi:outer membrane protein assembly factor BamB